MNRVIVHVTETEASGRTLVKHTHRTTDHTVFNSPLIDCACAVRGTLRPRSDPPLECRLCRCKSVAEPVKQNRPSFEMQMSSERS